MRLAALFLALGFFLAVSLGLWLIPTSGFRLVVVTATPEETPYPTWPVATATAWPTPERPLTATPTIPLCGEGGYVTRNKIRVCLNRTSTPSPPTATSTPVPTPTEAPPASTGDVLPTNTRRETIWKKDSRSR